MKEPSVLISYDGSSYRRVYNLLKAHDIALIDMGPQNLNGKRHHGGIPVAKLVEARALGLSRSRIQWDWLVIDGVDFDAHKKRYWYRENKEGVPE